MGCDIQTNDFPAGNSTEEKIKIIAQRLSSHEFRLIFIELTNELPEDTKAYKLARAAIDYYNDNLK